MLGCFVYIFYILQSNQTIYVFMDASRYNQFKSRFYPDSIPLKTRRKENKAEGMIKQNKRRKRQNERKSFKPKRTNE